MSVMIRRMAVVGALLAVAGCDQRNPVTSSPVLSPALNAQVSVDTGARFGVSGGTSLRETLTGAAINGVVPEGQAQADESNFANGGSTILTVQVKNVNLPDGTVLGVSLDFSPVERSRSVAGRHFSANLGHFGVSRDQVRVNNGATTILIGAFFN